MPQPPAADNWFEWLLPELQLKILDMRIVRARELKLARHTEFQMLAVELQHSLLDEDFENLHDAATAVMGEVNAAAAEEELAAALIEATSKSDGGLVAVSAAATSLEAAQASQPQQPTPQPAPAAASAAEINDEGVEGYLEAAGFAVTPPEAQDPLACEPLDVRSLHAALEALAAAGSGRRRADGSHQAARAALDGDDVMRVYGSGPCESLVVSFGSYTLQARDRDLPRPHRCPPAVSPSSSSPGPHRDLTVRFPSRRRSRPSRNSSSWARCGGGRS